MPLTQAPTASVTGRSHGHANELRSQRDSRDCKSPPDGPVSLRGGREGPTESRCIDILVDLMLMKRDRGRHRGLMLKSPSAKTRWSTLARRDLGLLAGIGPFVHAGPSQLILSGGLIANMLRGTMRILSERNSVFLHG